MEKSIITSGKTIELALEAALTQLGLERDDITYQVIALPKAGFLGFGAQPAKVQVSYEAPDPVPAAPEKPKSALGSASRSKPKAAAPVKKTEEPKAEPKQEQKAEAPKAEKERIRAERRAANPDGITENTSKKKMQKKQRAEEEAAKAVAAKEYAVKKGIATEEEDESASCMSGIPSRPYCKGRNYDPNRYSNTEE